MIKYINFKLRSGTDGSIKRLEQFDGLKDQIQSFMDVKRGEVPFLDWGEDVSSHLFRSVNADEITLLVEDLITRISLFFNIDFLDYKAIIDNDKINITLYLNYDDTIELEIGA